MKVEVTWTERVTYSSTIEVDEASVYDALRDQRDAEGRVHRLPEQLSEDDVLFYLTYSEQTWLEQVNAVATNAVDVTERDLEHVKL